MARLDLALLGGFHAARDGTPITGFDSDKTRALLVYLAVEAAYPQRREALAGLLWPEFADDAARRNLRYALFKLRQVLGEPENGPGFLLVTPQTVGLDPAAAVQLDVATFAGHLAACRAHRHRQPAACATCHAHREQAVALYRGELLHGFYLAGCQAFDEWLLLQRESLHRAAVAALDDLARYHAARAEDPQALAYTYRQLELEPWREEAHRQAMRLLARTGQRSAALAQYAACRIALATELNAEPSAETTALYQQVKMAPAAEAGGPPRPGAHPAPHPLTPLIGREAELRRLREWLDSPDYALLTIVGPGGVGKTRLALQVAHEQAGAFADGVYWVALAAISTPDLLAGSIAQALNLQLGATEDPAAQLVHSLRDKELLLVLDNFEQLQAGGAATELVLALLHGAPRLGLLVTSRERLGLQAESLLDLAGLSLPPEQRATGWPTAGLAAAGTAPHAPEGLRAAGAVQLFVERAQRASPAFTLSAETAPGVVAICRLVAGLPLGIVLAAAWVRHLPPARIAASIQANLDFLTSTARDVAPQHSSLRAVFQHSWSLLGAEEQQVFRRLAVFRGGWDEAAAERVAGARLWVRLALVDKSLLRQESTGRFEVHEVLRQYATEQLQAQPEEAAQVRQAHASYYLEFAEFAGEELRGGGQAEGLAGLEREHDNLRAALQWARDQGALEIGFRLAAALWRFWYLRGYFSEGRAQLAAMLAMEAAPDGPGIPPGALPPPQTAALLAAKAQVLNGAGVLAVSQGAPDAARAFYEQSLSLRRALGDLRGVAASLNNLGMLAHDRGDYAAARAFHEESLALRRELRDQAGLASSLNNLGVLAYIQGEYVAAEALYQESLALRRELGDKQNIAMLLSNLGIIAQSRGDYATARARHEESLAAMREVGDQHGIANVLTSLGIVAQNQAHYDTARAWHEASLDLSRALGDKSGVALSLHNLGVVTQMQGDLETAQALYQESLTLRRELGEKGGIAASLHNLGLVAQAQADVTTAGARHRASLALCWELGELRGVAGGLAGLGGVIVCNAQQDLVANPAGPPADSGPWEEAARLFAVVAALLERTGSVLDIEDRRPYERNVAVVRATLGAATFAAAWAAGRAWSLEHALSQALPE